MKNFLLFFIIVMVSACSREKNINDRLEFNNDVDGMAHWTDNPTIVKYNSHTGKFACRTDSMNQFSLTFRKRMGEITEKPIMRVYISAWIYVNNISADGRFVCALDSAPGVGYVYLNETFHIKKEREWTKVSSVFYLPKTYNPDFILSSYIWNTGKEEIYIDDFHIKLTEY